MSRSFIVKAHKVDIFQKSQTTNYTGQKKPVWTLLKEVPCGYTPAGSAATIRTYPTMEEGDIMTLYFDYDAPITYQSRLQNLRTKVRGEMIHVGPLEIKQINKHVSQLTGRVLYLEVRAKTVIE